MYTMNEIAAAAPAATSYTRHGVSDKYQRIDTYTVLSTLRREGFWVSSATQVKTRRGNSEARRAAAKHLLRFRKQDPAPGGSIPEIVLLNSHDGSCSFRLMLGIFRMACANGIIIPSSSFGSVAIRHVGNDVADAVIEGVRELSGKFDAVSERIEQMQKVYPEYADSAALERAMWNLRFPAGEDCDGIGWPTRREDLSGNLWTRYNVLQEKLLRGGVRYQTASGRNRTAVPIRSITEKVRLNEEAWKLAENLFLKLRQPEAIEAL